MFGRKMLDEAREKIEPLIEEARDAVDNASLSLAILVGLSLAALAVSLLTLVVVCRDAD